MGAAVQGEPDLVEAGRGFAFDLIALLPDSGIPRPASLHIGETWERQHSQLRRTEYEYDLIDFPHDRRRGYHLHHMRQFLNAAAVAVHEHCEEPMSAARCRHFLGVPVPDGYRAIELLLGAWTVDLLGCEQLPCLEQ